jgi:phage shock protein PspC (stress-responsive transcriptional regulator)
MANDKKLVRSNNKLVAGVCAGVAEYFAIDPTLVRVIYAALTLFTAGFPGVILYIVMMLIMPQPDGFNQNNQ